MTTSKNYDYLNRLTSISSSPSSSSSPSITCGYSFNNANQRTGRTEADASYWVYQYDSLGQVISGKKYFSDGTPVPGQQFEYGFDDIGNRTSAKAGGNAAGSALRSASYSANTLNQYTSREVPNAFDVLGASHATNSVTVNGSAADYSRGEYFQELISVVNSATSVWQTVSVTNSGGGSSTGNVFVAKTPEPFTYDLDGNLTQDGRWTYTWDAENRLTQAESLSSTPAASKRKVVWEYDAKGRRIGQTTSDKSSGSYVVTEDLKLLYDGWACVTELNYADNALKRSYVWGTDLSGTMTGAGGVGGLLMINSAANGAHFYAMDGNGNVTALVKASDGTLSATYEYEPFGKVLRATGPMADENVFGFSTKRTHRPTRFVLYEFRLYDPDTGRWLSRDPIEERGGMNLYGFVGQDPVSRTDRLGLFRDDYMTCPCRCVSVTVTYTPGGSSPPNSLTMYQHLFDNVFGSKISVAWKVTGNPRDCKYYQDETGTSSVLTGPGVNLVEQGVNHEVSQAYTDYMGATFHAVFPPPATATYNYQQTWRVVFRCVSSTEDGYTVERADSANWNQSFSYP